MKQLIPLFIQDNYLRQESHGYLRAYALFIDLSGFTPLTEGLMREGPRGAEQLSDLLNEIFEPLVRLVYARGGFIPYFAGDAFTAIFPDDSNERSARELIYTAAMARHLFQQRENRFGKYTIGIKLGLSYGTVEWGIVGDQYKSYYFRGQPIERSAYCQTVAGDQDIIIDDVLRNQLGGRSFRLEEMADGAYRVLGIGEVSYEWEKVEAIGEIKPEVAKVFLPPALVTDNQPDEFRTVISIFISFEGINDHEFLDRFVTVVLNQINGFSGYFKEADFGDKGGVLTAFFGAPISFENNAQRALEFVLSLREELQNLRDAQRFGFRVGMTVGTAFTGIVGGPERCQYACVGNRVNLAARIMTYADWGEVLVDTELQRTKYFRFLLKGDIKYKGIAENVPTFKLLGRSFESKPAYTAPLVERRRELASLVDFAQPIFDQRAAGIAYVYGEAGVGKSRLTYELRQVLTEAANVRWYLCQADQILRKPFNPFIYFLRNYFEQSPDSSGYVNRGNFEGRFRTLLQAVTELEKPTSAEVARELERTKPVLAALVGVLYQDSLWDQLDARGRYQNSVAAIVNLFIAESLVQPTVIELEDAHWIDDNSRELFQELARKMIDHPILLLVTSRYKDDGAKPTLAAPAFLEQLQLPSLEIDLDALPDAAVRAFAENTLEGPITDEFFDLLVRTTNSNPFYLEQMLEYFNESGLLEKEEGAWTIKDKNVKISNSINAILTARIDRLSAMVRETVKAAAVIGREFELPVLSEILKESEDFVTDEVGSTALLREQVKTAERGQIWTAMNELRYIFRHSLLREAVYSMQLRSRLQQLHKLIAQAIERLYADSIEERYVDLAFHYEQAGDFDKTCEYLRKAADYARSNYQNQQALDFYERLLQKLGRRVNTVDETRTHLKRGKVLELIGKWEESQQAFEQALRLAKKSRDVVLLGQANNNLGHLLMLRGDYDESMRYLQIAAGLFESIEDQVGIAKVFGDLGNLYFRQGEYEQAKSYFEQSIRTGYAKSGSAGSAQIVANLGLTHMNQGRYEAGIKVIKEQLRVSRNRNDKQAMATLLTNLGIVQFEFGDYDRALDSYEEGLRLAEELGNKQLVSIAIGSQGSVYQQKGDYEKAMSLYQRDLELTEELGDKQGIAIALGLVGELLSVMGEFHKAIEYLQKNLMLCEELGYQKGIAKAVNTLGDIFYFTHQYERSLHFYNRAIEVTRKIDNKLVLGFSLTEKGAVLIALNRLDELDQINQEALAIAEELGNPDLLYEARMLRIRTQHILGQVGESEQLLEDLAADNDLNETQRAGIYFEQQRLDPTNIAARQQARELYEKLYRETPRYIYRLRLDQLQ